MTRSCRTAMSLATAVALSGCVLSQTGGYAEDCDMPAVDGWHPGVASSHDRSVPSGEFSLSTRHLYYSDEPAMLIELGALVSPKVRKAYPPTLFDPRTAYLVIDGVRVPAQPTLRENPFMQPHWKRGGVYPVPANMNDGNPLVLTFPVRYRSGTEFTLHLGQFVIDGEPVAVPDIRYCYLPLKVKWSGLKISARGDVVRGPAA